MTLHGNVNFITDNQRYYRALTEHAWLLRAEGLKLHEIAVRLGVSKSTAHQKVKHQGRRMSWAMRRTRIRIVK